MTVASETEARIRRLYRAEKWRMGTIAHELGVHHSVVRRVLAADGEPLAPEERPSKIDPHVPWILATLRQHPRLPASRLYWMARERSYEGSESHFRRLIARLRPQPKAEAFLRLRTLPGRRGRSTGRTSARSRSARPGAGSSPSSWCCPGRG